MTITAKYTTRCPDCGNLIEPGTQVEWERGQKARHTECPEGQVAQAQEPRPQSRSGSDQPATEKQIAYALRLLDRMDEPLIADAFSPPSPAKVMQMTRNEISWLINALREDIY